MSCSLLQTSILSKNLSKDLKKTCLTSSGKGRLKVQNKTYIFGYESFLDNNVNQWTLALDFPMHNQESFKLDWSESQNIKFTASIEEKILRDNSNVDPKQLDSFITSLGSFIKEIIDIKNLGSNVSKSFKWSTDKKSIKAKDKDERFFAEFQNLTSDDYFGLMTIRYQFREQQSYKLDLVVRNCAE